MSQIKSDFVDYDAIQDAINDIESTSPIIKSLIVSLNNSVNNSKFEEARLIIDSIFKTLLYLSQLIDLIEKKLSCELDLSRITIDEKKVKDIEKEWLSKLIELKEASSQQDIIKACEIIKEDFPNGIDNQIKLLKKLFNLKKENNGIIN
ncbi:MAG: hypothetical protein N2446_01970 [Elusimicrobiales bacterium]|nr:hypothetical protein [Elusimicrobiales bacterium]